MEVVVNAVVASLKQILDFTIEQNVNLAAQLAIKTAECEELKANQKEPAAAPVAPATPTV